MTIVTPERSFLLGVRRGFLRRGRKYQAVREQGVFLDVFLTSEYLDRQIRSLKFCSYWALKDFYRSIESVYLSLFKKYFRSKTKRCKYVQTCVYIYIYIYVYIYVYIYKCMYVYMYISSVIFCTKLAMVCQENFVDLSIWHSLTAHWTPQFDVV